jgi:hypothetical protein
MLTFITTISNDVIPSQEDAIFSWKINGIPIIIAGNYSNPEKIREKIPEVTIIPNIRTESDMGFKGDAPIIKDMIQKTLPIITTPLIGLINADIIIEDTFLNNIKNIINKYGQDIFLTGNRRDVRYDVRNNTIERIKTLKTRSKEHQGKSGDIFISAKQRFEQMAQQMPEFIIGRMVWDNWIHIFFNKLVPCYNISPIAPTYHVDHQATYQTFVQSINHNYSLFHNMNLLDVSAWPVPL